MSKHVLPAVAAVLALAACKAPATHDTERTCPTSQALSDGELRGSSLPMKVLALTFDDGPGARTAELSSWLASQGVHVGFFVNGKNVHDPSVLKRIVDDGH